MGEEWLSRNGNEVNKELVCWVGGWIKSMGVVFGKNEKFSWVLIKDILLRFEKYLGICNDFLERKMG